MGIGFGLLCEKCGYEKDVMLGSGFSHGDPEGIIESCTKYDHPLNSTQLFVLLALLFTILAAALGAL